MKKDDLLAEVEAILADYELCDSCLGRLYGQRSHGLTNRQRGRSLRTALAIAQDRPLAESERCELCLGLCANLGGWASRCIDRVRELEFETFLVGNRLKEEVVENQSDLEEKFGLADAEDFGHAVNRVLGKKFRDGLAELGREVKADFETPDLTCVIDFRRGKIDLEPRPLYVYGRYRKLRRGIPQTIWHCPNCRGRGCEECSYTGRVYEDSIEERISLPLKDGAKGKDHKFHGGGREDVDVLTLGRGRPFVVEIREPRLRSLDFKAIVEEINAGPEAVEVTALQSVEEDAVRAVKQAEAEKIYRVVVELSRDVKKEDFFTAANELEGEIFQKTPGRVSHRRSNRVRVRRVNSIRTHRLSERRYRVVLRAESGLYIKELFSSDGTIPSLAEDLGLEISVRQLDVLDIPGELKVQNPEGAGRKKFFFEQSSQDVEKSFAQSN